MFTKNNIHLSVVDSTNTYALSLKNSSVFKEGLVVTASYQTSGKGQVGSSWESEAEKNLMLSVVIEPNLKLNKQFELNKIASLAIYDFLADLGIKSAIKWPNDVLVNKQKIAGILIQNIIKKDKINFSVIGIGLNINQLKFKNNKATSLGLLLSKELSANEAKSKLLLCLEKRIKEFREGISLNKDYLQALFLKDKVATFESESQKFMGMIRGVTQEGLLQVETESEEIKTFNLKEVKLLF